MKSLSGDTPLRLRAGLDPTLSGERLHTRIGWFDFTADDLAAVRALLDGAPRSVDEIGRPWPNGRWPPAPSSLPSSERVNSRPARNQQAPRMSRRR